MVNTIYTLSHHGYEFTGVSMSAVLESDLVNFPFGFFVVDRVSQIPFQIRLSVECDHCQTGFVQTNPEMLH